ncbi:putative nucleotidyltransferase [Pedobacter glucosidilyticus]|uniref:Nucleotidyltransferase domain-containing protein n=1 Tax=Pedobacter aquae TaxID=2605747 RepID=A0A5C0VNA8_9SPHI|nr:MULTISPECIES: nucleotidyltransferase domain-containing protein [Pedobacter]KHJ37331.1 putative nucleotidyltransferase [Pedobacter glucosidilyticus]QEK52790.1 nucleotidyltransferase domain-containing protein [Pedobacter aquae]
MDSLNDNIGLVPDDIIKIKTVFMGYPQLDSVLIYGSRAKGNYRPASDIDLTLIGKDLTSSLLNEIEFKLDDLLLPYKFDISIYDKITDAQFLDHINRIGKEFYRKQN